MLPAPKAILFDLDGTLLDGSYFRETIARTCARLAAEIPGLAPEAILEANTRVWGVYWPEVEERWTLGALDGATVSLEAWRRTLAACDVRAEALALLALETHAGLAREAHRLFEDVADVLASFRGWIPLGLITNGASDTQREKLRVTGIESLFDVLLISGEVGVAKPATQIFQLAAEGLGMATQDVWHVGDSLEADVAGARTAGLTAVWLNRAGAVRSPTSPGPNFEITGLGQLTDRLNLR